MKTRRRDAGEVSSWVRLYGGGVVASTMALARSRNDARERKAAGWLRRVIFREAAQNSEAQIWRRPSNTANSSRA